METPPSQPASANIRRMARLLSKVFCIFVAILAYRLWANVAADPDTYPSSAVAGFTLGLTTHNFEIAIPFFALTYVLFFLHWPKEA